MTTHPDLSSRRQLCIESSNFHALARRIAAAEAEFPARAQDPAKAQSFDGWCHAEAEINCGLSFDRATGIAVQPVKGVMVAGVHPYYEAVGHCFNTERIFSAVDFAANEPGCRALVLEFDSPGGISSRIEDAALVLASLSESRPELPVLSYISGMCCSAAAWVAAGTGERHAPRGATWGSIGAYIVTCDSSKFYEYNGLEMRLFADGQFKGMGEDGVKWSDVWYERIAANVRECGQRFKSSMKIACRRLTDDMMQGQSFTASASLEAGQVGDGWFLDSVPDIAGRGGFVSFAEFLDSLREALA